MAKKSISDILSQADRILATKGLSKSRQVGALMAADRYTDNIMNSRRFQKDSRFKAYDRKYSRSAYMGLTDG